MGERVPKGLGSHAARFWRDVTAGYDLRVDELLVLEQVCRELDLIEKIAVEQARRPMVTEGSMGQEVADPMIQELRQHRAILARLLAQLRLPNGETASEISDKARAAANARWSKRTPKIA